MITTRMIILLVCQSKIGVIRNGLPNPIPIVAVPIRAMVPTQYYGQATPEESGSDNFVIPLGLIDNRHEKKLMLVTVMEWILFPRLRSTKLSLFKNEICLLSRSLKLISTREMEGYDC